MPQPRQYIAQGARRRGLDPRAVLAVSQYGEGAARALRGGISVGDNNTSFGPFMLHAGGKLPRGRGSAWAHSNAGIDYALDEIAKVARGLRGRAAIAAIVKRFEVPANPGAEIQRALAGYGQVQVGGGDAGQGPRPVPLNGLATTPNTPEIAQALISQIGSSSPDYSQVLGLIHQHAQTKAAEEAHHIITAAHPATPTPMGKVALSMGADRHGVRTSRAVLDFVGKIAGLARTELTIGTGTNHSRMTVNGNVSDHWSGHGADIPATGANLIHLGRLALIAAGAPPAWAMKQKGGLYNVKGHQVIFNTHKGGNHTNHLHVSAH